ncbi:MAG: dihydroorotase family protein [Deltaproteobacteria bacterium]|nr:dihydroorotase family protein [Deltaproteobacteria bacterium]
MASLLLQNVRLLCSSAADEKSNVAKSSLFDVLLRDDVVVQIASSASIHDDGPGIKNNSDASFDGRGGLLLPAAIDLSPTLQGPALAHVESTRQALDAACRGGIAHLLPRVMDATMSGLPFSSWAALSPEETRTHLPQVSPVAPIANRSGDLAEMATAQQRGARLVNDGFTLTAGPELLRRALQYAAGLGLRVQVGTACPELSGKGCIAESPLSVRLGLEGIPSSAETTRVWRDLELAEETGAKVLVGPISCARSAQAIRDARKRGVDAMGLVSIFHLLLDEKAHQEKPFDARLHLRPPLRSTADRQALRMLLVDGHAVLGSQHQARGPTEKEVPYDESAPGGASLSVFTALGCDVEDFFNDASANTEQADSGALSPKEFVQAASLLPAQAVGINLGLGDDGEIQKGALANLMILQPPKTKATAEIDLPSPLVGQPCSSHVAAMVIRGVLHVFTPPAQR